MNLQEHENKIYTKTVLTFIQRQTTIKNVSGLVAMTFDVSFQKFQKVTHSNGSQKFYRGKMYSRTKNAQDFERNCLSTTKNNVNVKIMLYFQIKIDLIVVVFCELT